MGGTGIDLEGKVAVVVGGTTGLGHAIALGLARAGADVVASSRRLAAVERVATEIEGLGRRTLRLPSDVGDRASLVTLEKRVRSELGAVDVLVNCAGITRRVPTLEQSEEDFNAIMDTNLNGTLRGCQIFGATMVECGSGSIINIASLASFRAFFEVAAYTASKSAVVGLTRALAVEWGQRGVRVNAIAPGVFPTAINREVIEGTPRGEELIARTPMGRFGEACEVSGAAVFLASDAAAFVTGEVLAVDGGFLASGVNC